MAYYVLLISWTDQGIRNVKETTNRITAAEQLFQKHGAKLGQIYMTMGHYDYVAISEAPDDESMTKALLALGTLGNVRTETMRAYGRDELAGLVGGLQ
jgi:uncharacterized protein with GYD domain